MSLREKQREDELRANLRREIEEELKAIKDPTQIDLSANAVQRFPARALNNEEMKALTSSEDFLDFVDRSSKVIERALDEEYDVLADYAMDGMDGYDEDEDEGYASARGRKGRRLKEVAQFYDERWCKKRMISDINFSPKVYDRPYLSVSDVNAFSSPSFFLHPTLRTHRHRRIPPASYKSGTFTFTPVQNTLFTALPIYSLPNSPRSIPL